MKTKLNCILLITLSIILVQSQLYSQEAKSQKPGVNDETQTDQSVQDVNSREEKKTVDDEVVILSKTIFIDAMEADKVDFPEYTFEGEYPKVRGMANENLENEVNQIFITNYKNYLKKSKDWDEFIHARIYFQILSLSDDLISVIQYNRYQYGDGNGWGADADVVNIDLKKGRLLTNEDFNLSEISLEKYNETIFMYFLNKDMFMDNSYTDPLEYYRKPDEMNHIPVVKNYDELNKINFGIKNNILQVVEFASPGARVYETVYVIPINKKYSP